MATNGIDALRQGILQEAEAMAREEAEEARRSSEEAMERARKEAEGEADVVLRRAQREAEALRRRVASVTELEAKRRWLDVRERLIRETLEHTLQILGQAAGTDAYRPLLLRLLVEAAREAGGGRLQLRTSATDARLVTRKFLDEARKSLAREGVSVELEPSASPVEIVGGVIVLGDEGRLVVDNSLESRMQRQEAALRSGIWRILSGEEDPKG